MWKHLNLKYGSILANMEAWEYVNAVMWDMEVCKYEHVVEMWKC